MNTHLLPLPLRHPAPTGAGADHPRIPPWPCRNRAAAAAGTPRRLVGRLPLALALAALLAGLVGAAGAMSVDAVGEVIRQVEGRVTLQVLAVEGVASAAASAPIAVGDTVVFTVPRPPAKGRKAPRLSFREGDVVRASLVGALTTEYSEADVDPDSAPEPGAQVYVWSAQTAEKVKNPGHYLPDDPSKKSRGRRRGRGRDRKREKEPPRVFTQEETVRGTIAFNRGAMYLQEAHFKPRKRNRGLLITDATWLEKLRTFVGQQIVVHGTTHRTSVSSGTVEIKTVLRLSGH